MHMDDPAGRLHLLLVGGVGDQQQEQQAAEGVDRGAGVHCGHLVPAAGTLQAAF